MWVAYVFLRQGKYGRINLSTESGRIWGCPYQMSSRVVGLDYFRTDVGAPWFTLKDGFHEYECPMTLDVNSLIPIYSGWFQVTNIICKFKWDLFPGKLTSLDRFRRKYLINTYPWTFLCHRWFDKNQHCWLKSLDKLNTKHIGLCILLHYY